MDLRQQGLLSGVVAALLPVVSLAAACGEDRDGRLATTPLPLQPSGLAVGGDVQAQATDVAETRITEQQLRQIADACRKATELPQVGTDTCGRQFRKLRWDQGCRQQDLCVKGFEVSSGDAPVAGYIEIIDSRPPGESVCEPTNVCLRVGVPTPDVLNQIIGPARRTTSPTGSVGPTESPTASPTLETSTPAPTVTTLEPSSSEPGPPQPGSPPARNDEP